MFKTSWKGDIYVNKMQMTHSHRLCMKTTNCTDSYLTKNILRGRSLLYGSFFVEMLKKFQSLEGYASVSQKDEKGRLWKPVCLCMLISCMLGWVLSCEKKKILFVTVCVDDVRWHLCPHMISCNRLLCCIHPYHAASHLDLKQGWTGIYEPATCVYSKSFLLITQKIEERSLPLSYLLCLLQRSTQQGSFAILAILMPVQRRFKFKMADV